MADCETAATKTLIEHAIAGLISEGFLFAPSDTHALQIEAGAWPSLARVAESHGVAPLLYASLKKRGSLNHLPAGVREGLRVAYLRASVSNWLAFDELSALLGRCTREQIPVVVLKGAALAHLLYEDPALRPVSDLDLLVPLSTWRRVQELLADRGFEVVAEAESFDPRYRKEQMFQRGGNRPAAIDVHWHLFSSRFHRQRVPIEWLWQRTVAISFGNHSGLVLTPEAQLLHLVTHFSYEHRSDRLIWSFDLALLMTRYRQEINWEDVIDTAVRFGLAQCLKVGLGEVADRWGVLVPDAARLRLAAFEPSLAERLVFDVANAPHSELSAILDGLSRPGLTSKIDFFWRRLFPSVSDIRRKYQAASAWQIATSYAHHYTKRALRVVYSVVWVLRLRTQVKG